MSKTVGILTILLCLLFYKSTGQSFPEFDSLKKKSYDAYEKKDFRSALNYFERMLRLPEAQRPEIDNELQYDIACIYSLNKNTNKALDFLERSFDHERPVSLSHILTDDDLDFIRSQPRFLRLLDKVFLVKEKDLGFHYAKEVSYQQLLNYIKGQSSASDRSIVISEKVIYWEKQDTSYVYNDKTLPLPNFEPLKTRNLEFVECTFVMNFIWNSGIDNMSQAFPYQQLTLDKCRFLGRFFIGSLDFIEPPLIANSKFSDIFWMKITVDPAGIRSHLRADLNTFKDFKAFVDSKNRVFHLDFTDNVFKGKSVQLICDNTASAVFLNDSIASENFYLSLISVGILKFNKCTFNNFVMSWTRIESEFDFQNSIVHGKMLLRGSIFNGDPVNDVDWEGIDSLRLGICSDCGGGPGSVNPIAGKYRPAPNKLQFNTGETLADISDTQRFRELMGVYSMFLNLFKSKSDLESYNGCFITIKELQTKRLKYLYESNNTFKNYFRWKLSQLLKFYVNHGTDPAQAIVISIYIIIAFGVFFFFFPSDWDVTSKKRLLENFKDFIQKNEKGYIRPFFVLMWGFIISMVNAITLSLNAFITLGFGNIPTHGIARYFCVLEGFLGWFLLSIFTVAMINQVL